MFVRRENRFAATVDLNGGRELVHVPNSGRMRELLLPGAEVLLLEARSPTRRTAYDLVAAETSQTLVSVDSRVPNAVVSEALSAGAVPDLEGYPEVSTERTWGGSRFDFHLGGPGGEALLEVKGCTLVEEDGLALFPDAPTLRGARHMRELAHARKGGIPAFVIVVVQREDGRVFSPNDRTDPNFGDAMREAAAAGVRVLAFSTTVTRDGVELASPLPVDLEAARRSMA